MTNAVMTKTQVFLRLVSYIKPYSWTAPFIILGFAISAGTEVSIAKLLEFITDAINNNDRNKMVLFPSLVVLLFVMRGIGAFLGGYYSSYVARHLVYQLRIDAFAKLLKMPSIFYLSTPAGVISSKLIFDVEQVTAASTEALVAIVKDGLTVIALFGYLFYANWRLTLVLLVVLPPVLWLVDKASKKFATLSLGIQDSMAGISHITNETITGHQIVKNYGGQAYELARFNEASQKNLDQGMKMAVIGVINTPLIQFFMALGMCFVVWISLRPEVLGESTAGEFISYLTAIGLLSKPVRSLTDVNVKLQRGIAAGLSVFGLIDSPQEQDLGVLTPVITGDISFDEVSLVYENGVRAISDFSLTIKKGESVAIVGRSGSGKTSLVNLLVRALSPSSGQIRIDGIPIDEIKLSALHEQIAMVGQQVVLFNDTVAGNIAYGNLSSKSKDELIAACKAAYAHQFIRQLPKGYDSVIGADGLQLSGGQRQRLSVARALLKDAPILILDEATSALDNESEFFIQKALDEVIKNRTTLVIAHRLSTVKNADRIVVMDNGRIVEIGTHDTLLAKGGHYATLYERKFS